LSWDSPVVFSVSFFDFAVRRPVLNKDAFVPAEAFPKVIKRLAGVKKWFSNVTKGLPKTERSFQG
jgi:hypothetical protein